MGTVTRWGAGVRDRAAGALVGLAAGDALGAGYEFGSAPLAGRAEMIGGGLGGFAPGEWTDDTAMAVAVAEGITRGRVDLHAIAARFLDWYATDPPDVGNQTRAVLGAASGPDDLAARAAAHFARDPHGSAGNGSLMRTAAVALAHLGDDAGLAADARAVSDLTHADPVAGDACVLWCVAIDRAIRERRLDGVRDGLALLPVDRRPWWTARLDDAERGDPARLRPNGYVVTALQAAHAAIHLTPVPAVDPRRHLEDALQTAVRIGDDTDTVAAIAGQLLGARWGAAAVPDGWRAILHGWPGLDADGLVRLAHGSLGVVRSD